MKERASCREEFYPTPKLLSTLRRSCPGEFSLTCKIATTAPLLQRPPWLLLLLFSSFVPKNFFAKINQLSWALEFLPSKYLLDQESWESIPSRSHGWCNVTGGGESVTCSLLNWTFIFRLLPFLKNCQYLKYINIWNKQLDRIFKSPFRCGMPHRNTLYKGPSWHQTQRMIPSGEI